MNESLESLLFICMVFVIAFMVVEGVNHINKRMEDRVGEQVEIERSATCENIDTFYDKCVDAGYIGANSCYNKEKNLKKYLGCKR